jgi:hypothetical protein
MHLFLCTNAFATATGWVTAKLANGTGNWRKVRVGEELASVDWLEKDGGVIGFQLSTSPSSTVGVHDVEVSPSTPLPAAHACTAL